MSRSESEHTLRTTYGGGAWPDGDSVRQPLTVTAFRCEPLAEDHRQALGFTYWFDAAPIGDPYPVTLRFTGRRVGVKGKAPTGHLQRHRDRRPGRTGQRARGDHRPGARRRTG